jgi:aryl carrier-like protein
VTHLDPAVDQSSEALSDHASAQLQELTARVALVWREVLGVPEPVDADDDFFDLGGHSLLGMRMLALVDERVGVTCAFRDLVGHPTLGGFCRVLLARGGAR